MCGYYGTNFVEMLRRVFCPLPHVGLLLRRILRRTSWFGVIIYTSKVSGFPGVKPMIHGHTIHLKKVHKLCGRMTMQAQEETVGALSDTMLLAVFVYALYHTDGFLADMFDKSHR